MGREVGGGPEWGTHVNPWLIHVNVWQKPLQYCEVISLQLIKINGGKKKNIGVGCHFLLQGIFPAEGSNTHLLHWQVASFATGPPFKAVMSLNPETVSFLS